MVRDGLDRLRSRAASRLAARRGSAPAAPTLPLLPGEALLALRDDPLGFLCGAVRARGDLVALGWGRPPLLLLVHPEHAHHVLVTRAKHYDKNTRGYRTLRIFLGQGLLTSEGEAWRQSRRIAQPAFHRDRIARFAETMVELTADTLDTWRPDATVDMHEEMTRLTLRIVTQTLLGSSLGDHDDVGPALARLNAFARHMISHPWTLPPSAPTPRNFRYRRAARVLDMLVEGLIAQRRRDPGDHADLLAMLMDASDEDTGARLSDRQLRDEAMTIFVAGHETTAAALAWTLALLSLHPEVDRRLGRELQTLGGRPPTFADLPALPYTAAVVKESLRLYPPAWAISRRARGRASPIFRSAAGSACASGKRSR